MENNEVNIGYVIASRLVAINHNKVKWMYRESPEDLYDSGWRVFSGEEDEDLINDPNNFEIYDVQTILNIDDSIKEIILSPIGSEFYWSEKKKQWIRLKNNRIE